MSKKEPVNLTAKESEKERDAAYEEIMALIECAVSVFCLNIAAVCAFLVPFTQPSTSTFVSALVILSYCIIIGALASEWLKMRQLGRPHRLLVVWFSVGHVLLLASLVVASIYAVRACAMYNNATDALGQNACPPPQPRNGVEPPRCPFPVVWQRLEPFLAVQTTVIWTPFFAVLAWRVYGPMRVHFCCCCYCCSSRAQRVGRAPEEIDDKQNDDAVHSPPEKEPLIVKEQFIRPRLIYVH